MVLACKLKCYNPKIFHGSIIPCGKCYACRLKRSQDWQIRLHEELRSSDGCALFMTLTYDDACLNIVDGRAVLSRRDIQLFHKRVRKKIDKRLNYFLVGEYGPTTLRPHYHVIYFGLDYTHLDIIGNEWNKGFYSGSLVSDGRISYVAKYSLLPTKLDEFYMKKEYKPFMVCSKGMGAGFLENPQTHAMYNSDDKQYYNDNGYKKNLPRYYKDKLFSPDKLRQFAKEYYDKSKEELTELLELQKTSPDEFARKLKFKKDWIYSHAYDVENRLLKKPKI